jgi:Helix-turn-helix domain
MNNKEQLSTKEVNTVHSLLQQKLMFYSGLQEDRVYTCISAEGMRNGLIRILGIQTFIFYVFLLAHYNKATGEAFPGYASIRKHCGLGNESIRTAINTLRTMDMISLRKGENGNFIYTVHDIELVRLEKDILESFDDDDELNDQEQEEFFNSILSDELGL